MSRRPLSEISDAATKKQTAQFHPALTDQTTHRGKRIRLANENDEWDEDLHSQISEAPDSQSYPLQYDWNPVELRKQIVASLPPSTQHAVKAFLQMTQAEYHELTSSSVDQGRGQLEEAFRMFCVQEVALSNRPVEDLVIPSGSLFAPVGLKLHYPTFSGTNLHEGEVANPSFACIRILVSKGLSNACWYEAFFRREKFPERPSGSVGKRPAPPMKDYSSSLSACHLAYSSWCEQQPIVVLFGEHVLKIASSDKAVERINVLDPPIGLLLFRESDKIIKICVVAPHPQTLLMSVNGRTRDGLSVARNMDRAINAAVALCPLGTNNNEIDPTYFERLILHKSSEAANVFNRNPRTAMIEGLQVEKQSGVSLEYDKMDPSILSWLKSEKGVNDPKATITAEAYQAGVTCLQIVQRMMTKKGNKARNDNLDKKRDKSAVNFERTTKRQSDPLTTQCEVCGVQSVDSAPLYGTEGEIKGLYIARTTKACPGGCCKLQADRKTPGKTSRAIDLVPVDETVRFVRQLAFRRLVQAAQKQQERDG